MPHDLLVSILHSKGVSGKLLYWISDFLRARTFSVKVGKVFSKEETVQTGAPQGTVLESLVFMIFINGMRDILPTGVQHVTYADDVRFFAPIQGKDDTLRLQAAITDFAAWSRRMGLV